MNSILQAWVHQENATGISQPTAEEKQQREAANTALTIEDLRNEMKKVQREVQSKRKNKRKDPLPAQGKDENGDNITYCWSHGITRNLWHNGMTYNRCKEGHKKEVTLQNKLGGSEERCKPRSA